MPRLLILPPFFHFPFSQLTFPVTFSYLKLLFNLRPFTLNCVSSPVQSLSPISWVTISTFFTFIFYTFLIILASSSVYINSFTFLFFFPVYLITFSYLVEPFTDILWLATSSSRFNRRFNSPSSCLFLHHITFNFRNINSAVASVHLLVTFICILSLSTSLLHFLSYFLTTHHLYLSTCVLPLPVSYHFQYPHLNSTVASIHLFVTFTCILSHSTSLLHLLSHLPITHHLYLATCFLLLPASSHFSTSLLHFLSHLPHNTAPVPRHLPLPLALVIPLFNLPDNPSLSRFSSR